MDMKKRYNVLLSWDNAERVWVAYAPTLNWLSTYGETREDALEQVREAIIGYLEAAEKEGLEAPPGDTEAELAAIEVTSS